MNTYRIRVGDLRRILKEATAEELDEAGFMSKVKAAALGAGIAAAGMGALPSAAHAKQPEIVKQAKLKDPKDNDKKFQFGSLKDPKDNDKKFEFGKNLDPKEQSELVALDKQIKDYMAKYKGNPMQDFFMRGFRAMSSDPDGKKGALRSAHQELMLDLKSKHMSHQVPLSAFNDGVEFAKLRIEREKLRDMKL